MEEKWSRVLKRKEKLGRFSWTKRFERLRRFPLIVWEMQNAIQVRNVQQIKLNSCVSRMKLGLLHSKHFWQKNYAQFTKSITFSHRRREAGNTFIKPCIVRFVSVFLLKHRYGSCARRGECRTNMSALLANSADSRRYTANNVYKTVSIWENNADECAYQEKLPVAPVR